MRRIDWAGLSRKISRITWALFFVALPVTSFPFFPSGLGGKTLVRPLSTYPLLLLLALVVLPRLVRRPLPRTTLPLLTFVIIALISSLAAFSADVESLRGVTIFDRFLRNVVTLGLGIAFYFTVILLPERWEDLDYSLRWLYVGFGLALLWGTFQAVYLVYFSPTYFGWLNQLQSLLSIRKLFANRISGMTYEPKWFAEQISFVLLPWLMAAVLSKRSVFPYRFKWITVEWGLLGWSVVILVFTFSRTGLLLMVLMALLGFLLWRFFLHAPRKGKVLASGKRNRRNILEIVVVICGLMALFVAVGSQSTYVSRFWLYFTDARERERSYLEFIAVQQRVVYWETALRTFEAYPLFGVGLGNYAFYFEEMLPDERFHSQEIIRQTTPVEGRDRLITPKNLMARLLAETGIFGTVAFITFVFAVAGCVLFLWFSTPPEQKFFGIGGILGMVVFSILMFSFDSFALPNMWIFFGLVTAAAHLPDPVKPG